MLVINRYMREQDFETVLVKHPSLIEEGLVVLERQVTVSGRRIDILFEDRNKRRLIVELKIGPIKDEHIGQVLTYQGSLLTCDDPTVRVMLVANIVAPSVRKVLDHYGIGWRELTLSSIRDYLIMKGDTEFLHLFEVEDVLPVKNSNRRVKERVTVPQIELPPDYSCNRCRFSISTLEEMSEKTGTGEKFHTAGGQREMNIFEVNGEKGYLIIFRRSSGNLTWKLELSKIKNIHDMIHEGKIDNDYKQIDRIYPLWGNYISGLLKHLGCFGKRF